MNIINKVLTCLLFIVSFNTTRAQNNDSIILAQLSENIEFNWNKNSYKIVDDSLFKKIKSHYPQLKNELVYLLTNTEETALKICASSSMLVKGDFAFLLIDKMVKLPYFTVFEIQFDVLEMGCQFPLGLFDYLNSNRVEVKLKIDKYLCNK